jgi:CRISPR-associated protein Csc2
MKFLSAAQKIGDFFHPEEFPSSPTARFIHIVLLRKSDSELVLRTDEGITKEMTRMGYQDVETKPRVVFTKRKAVAPERRTGREFLRFHGILVDDCSINASMCGKCPDCLIYGYAAAESGKESKGSLKSRVLTEDGYSILSASEITELRTFNALSELETMVEFKDGKPEMRQSLGAAEYVKPEAHFVDVETLRDIREPEFIYVLGSILRTTRYGAMSSRIGKVSNIVVAIVGAEAEIFSSLQLTKLLWDNLSVNERTHPLKDDVLTEKLAKIIEDVCQKAPSRTELIVGDELKKLLDETKKIYQNPKDFVEALRNLKGILASKTGD